MIGAAATRRNQKTSVIPPLIDTRLPAIDRLRGLVILLMALDHVRDFFNLEAMQFDPLDLSRTYPALFLTRLLRIFAHPLSFSSRASPHICMEKSSASAARSHSFC